MIPEEERKGNANTIEEEEEDSDENEKKKDKNRIDKFLNEYKEAHAETEKKIFEDFEAIYENKVVKGVIKEKEEAK